MSQETAWAYHGSFFHAPTYGEFEYLENAIIEVDGSGVITRVVTGDDPSQQEFILAHRKAGTITELPEGSYGLPGFVDMHVHSCQWPQAALALDEPLYRWLQERTFPLESRFEDIEFARRVYSDLVQQLLARGTTTTVYLGSAHLEATLELARICADAGQRALVGKTVMDDPVANPDYYRDESPAKIRRPSYVRSTGCARACLRASGRWLRRASFRAALTRFCLGSVNWRRNTDRMCRPIATKANGSTTLCLRDVARKTRMRLEITDFSDLAPSWRIAHS